MISIPSISLFCQLSVVCGRAKTTEGNYFRATSNSKLKEVYEEIDKLEKTKLNVKEYSKRQEEYRWFALAAFLCVLLEVLLRNSILKKIP